MSCTPARVCPQVVTEQDMIDALVRQLSGGSNCDQQLTSLIPAFWELTRAEGCYSNYIHMLLTKREAILALMGCEAYSVDQYDYHRVMDARTVADSVHDSRHQAQSTGDSVKFGVSHGETRYDEVNKARSTGDFNRHALATEVGDGRSFYRDDGHGDGFNNSQSTNTITVTDDETITNTVQGSSAETGSRSDCNYEYSTNHTVGSALGIIIAAFSFSGGGSEWRKYTKTRAHDDDRSFHESKHGRRRDVNDDRSGQGTHEWQSRFFADIEWHERDYEVRTNHDRSDTRRHAEAHASGDGDGLSEEKMEGRNAAQGTAKLESVGKTDRNMVRTDNINAIKLANSQRFRNLRLIYDQLTEQIELAKRRFRGRAFARVATMRCNCNACCHCLGIICLNQLGYRSHYDANWH